MNMPRAYQGVLDAAGSESGQTMAEYALVGSVITVAVFLTLGTLTGAVAGLLEQVAGLFPS